MRAEIGVVPDGHRGRGHATAPTVRADVESLARGAIGSALGTFSFQVPGFYRKLGHRDFAQLDRLPAGHRRHHMTKTP